MTIKKRLARSNIAMLVIPLLVAAALLLGVGAVLLLLRENMTTLHDAMEQMERVLHGFKLTLSIYAAAALAVLLAAAALTDLYLTRSLFRHISRPLDTLTAGVARIRDGDLDAPIAYDTPDEFKAACDAVDEMAARLFAFARMDVSQYPVHPEPLALRPALEAVAGEQEGAAVTVDVPDMTVRADRELLRRIAVNLLDNSRKYGGRADVLSASPRRRTAKRRPSPLPTTARGCRRSSCPGCLMRSIAAMPPGPRPAAAAASAWRW